MPQYAYNLTLNSVPTDLVLSDSVCRSVFYHNDPLSLCLGDIRPEAVHLHGTDHMSTRDVFSYFSAYAPRNIEWIDDSSCMSVCLYVCMYNNM